MITISKSLQNKKEKPMNLRKHTFLAACLPCLSFLILVMPVQAEDWWESKQESHPTDQIELIYSDYEERPSQASRVNWEDGYIEVKAGATADMEDAVNQAHGYAIALKTARHLAYEKMAETVAGVNLMGDATYDRELMVDANLKTMVRAMIRNARVVDESQSQFGDGSIWAEVTLGMMLYGENGLIGPSLDWYSRQRVTPTPMPVPTSSAANQPSSTDNTVYTGLIIDATGMDANPAMLPKIFSQNGQVLFGTGKIDREYVVKHGLMGYQRSLEKAKSLNRVGNNPLIISPISIRGTNRSDFVVSPQDAERIRMAASQQNFLGQCRVVAVVN
jgi:hypothetical protein